MVCGSRLGTSMPMVPLPGIGGYDADAQRGERQGYVVLKALDLGYAHALGGHDFVEGDCRAYGGFDAGDGDAVVVQGLDNHVLVGLLLHFVAGGFTRAVDEQVGGREGVAAQLIAHVERGLKLGRVGRRIVVVDEQFISRVVGRLVVGYGLDGEFRLARRSGRSGLSLGRGRDGDGCRGLVVID